MTAYFAVAKRIALYLARTAPAAVIDHLAYEVSLLMADDAEPDATATALLAADCLPVRPGSDCKQAQGLSVSAQPTRTKNCCSVSASGLLSKKVWLNLGSPPALQMRSTTYCSYEGTRRSLRGDLLSNTVAGASGQAVGVPSVAGR